MCRMVLEWREREHGDVEEAVRVDLMAQQVLRATMDYSFFAQFSYAFNVSKGFLIYIFNGAMKGRI